MLPTPLISDWSSSARLTPVRRRAQPASERGVVEGGLQRVARDVGDRRPGSSAPSRHEQQVAERALVDEAQLGPAVGEGEPDPQVRRQRPVRLADQQLAAHAQVGRAARRRRRGSHRYLPRRRAPATARPASAGGEVGGAGQVPADRARVQHLDGRDGAAGHPALQAAADGLDLGQFRHASGSAASEPAAGRGWAGSSAGTRGRGLLAAAASALMAFQAASAACCSASFLLRPSPAPSSPADPDRGA